MSRSMSAALSVKLLVCVVSLFGFAAPAFAQTPSPSPSPQRTAPRPLPSPQYIPPHDYDQQNIKLDLRFDFAKEQAIGTETITLAPTVRDLQRVNLDAAYMVLESAKLDKGTPLKFAFDEKKQNLSIELDHPYQ